MIPATHWHDNNDGTAWWVVDPVTRWEAVYVNNRPCDTCGGKAAIMQRKGDGADWLVDCPGCDGTGRHTFTIHTSEVFVAEDGENAIKVRTLRVHVVDVLPIVESDTGWRCIEAMPDGTFQKWDNIPPLHSKDITLPPDAAPGKWAIRLQRHEPENVETSTMTNRPVSDGS